MKLPSYSNNDIIEKRVKIEAQLKSKPILMSEAVLTWLWDEYNQAFFKGGLVEITDGNKVAFAFSNRMTKAGGKTVIQSKITDSKGYMYEIRISGVLLKRFMHTQGAEKKSVAGINVYSPQQALLIIFEHELLHIIEHFMYKKTSCKQARFKKMAQDIFGHTQSTHALLEVSQNIASHNTIGVGECVVFQHKGSLYQGKVIKITKRATVMCPSKEGMYRDQQGKRYNKYYVPLGMLTVVK